MSFSFLQILSASLLLLQTPSLAPPVPADGPPLPWAAVSIHVSNPDQQDYSSHDQPDGITDNRISLNGLISQGYAFSVMPFREDEISGMPDWARHTRYDVLARVDPDDVPAFRKLSDLSMQQTIEAFAARQPTGEMLMVQHLLADRFALRAHWQTEERNVYILTVAKSGLRLKTAADPKHGQMNFSHDELSGKGVPVSFLAKLLALPAGRSVVDQTGLQGTYDFDLHFDPQDNAQNANGQPAFFQAVQEQLGLVLRSARAPMPVLVIDHVEQPTSN